jgi:hypothetical protein
MACRRGSQQMATPRTDCPSHEDRSVLSHATFPPSRSGKRVTLPAPPPLETARAPFDACCLSRANALFARQDAAADDPSAHLHATPTGPFPVDRGGRTSKPRGCRHLLCLPQRLTEFPRAARPEGSQRPCGRGPVPPLSARLPDGLRFLPPPLPAAASEPLAGHLPRGTATGLPRSAGVPAWVRPRLSAEGAPSAPGEFGTPGPDPVPFGPSVSAPCAGHQ